MVRFVLDTSALAEPLRASPNAKFMRRFRAHGDAMAIAATTWHESLFGLRRMPKGARRDAIEDYLKEIGSTMTVLPYDDRAADVHARERVRLERAGKTPPFADGQIAAVAIASGLTLVTSNVRDFAAFEDLDVTSWRD